MDQVYEKQLNISPSICDASGRLSHPGTFSVFMDLAGEHAELLGVGLDILMPQDLFWLTVKTRIEFHERPRLSEIVTARTWPEKPGPIRSNRSYQLLRGDEILVAGKTEWVVMNVATHAPVPPMTVFPPLDFDRPGALPKPFARFTGRFDGVEPFAEYRVRSTDIDVGGHMNNAAYLRALFSCWSSAEVNAMDIHSIDVSFRASCFEGETLQLRRLDMPGCTDICISRGDDTVLLVRIQ
ncbi:MAG: hypothetical protein IJV41_09700 [Oscillospiraceae bacterium]|nr:hypothetical protein [Oscillospiraceae bacterium]